MYRDAAIIEGSLIDVRNAGQHKEVVLKIAVPAELAKQVVDAFGWPTQVNPVHVAVARLKEEVSNESKQAAKVSAAPATSPKPARPWNELSPAQQAGIRCNEPAFRRFLREGYTGDFADALAAADFVRKYCGVESRANIQMGKESGARWAMLNSEFQVWMREPELVG